MSSEDFAIRVTDVTKRYMMYARPEDRLKQSIMPRLQRLVGQPPTKYYKDFDALHGVSFSIGRGETVGIVGRNGSGKSTLLQVICGTLTPTSGTVEVRGRIAALLELGAGFNPEFSGRENVYMNAAILGLSREETDSRFEAITAFAGIGDFLEHPVKTYSSGMFVRLAFAVAINVDPDILVVDEALSVGDEAFQRKCFARIEQIKERGATILFVSHGAQAIIQLCDRAILMDGGEKLIDGEPKPVVTLYQSLINATGENVAKSRAYIKSLGPGVASWDPTEAPYVVEEASAVGVAPALVKLESYDPDFVSQSILEERTEGARICDPVLRNLSGERVTTLEYGRRYAFEYVAEFSSRFDKVSFGYLIKTVSGLGISGTSSRLFEDGRNVSAGDTIKVRFEWQCSLMPGTYFLNAGIGGMAGDADHVLHRINDVIVFRVVSSEPVQFTGLVDMGLKTTVTTVAGNHKERAA